MLSKGLNSNIYETTILPIVLYGCETWSRTLWEEHRLRVFKNRVLRSVYGPKGEKVVRDWRRLHNEELRNLYASLNIVTMKKRRITRLAGPVARMGEIRNACNIFVGELEAKRPLGRHRHKWEDIRMS
jgi:hypothetical protein